MDEEARAGKTTAERLKFQMEFSWMMSVTGRGDMAAEAAKKALDLVNQLIEEGH